MIGRLVSRPKRPQRLLEYLFGPGRNDEHVSSRLVASWCGDSAHLEPPGIGTRNRPTRRLAQILEVPVLSARGKVPSELGWHCVVRAADADPKLSDDWWRAICAELMHRVGLSVHGDEDKGVRWVAVHHGGNHVHIVAVLARLDGRPVRLRGDWYRIQEAMAWAERQYGLTPVARAGARGTAARRPTRAETEKARRLVGHPDRPPARAAQSTASPSRARPPRVRLRRLVEAAAAATQTEAEFFGNLAARGVVVRFRESPTQPGQVIGYAIGLRSDTTGEKDGPVWFGGGKLAPDLSLPRLRARWAGGPPRSDQPGLSGRAMSELAARPVLTREVLRVARGARSEREFLDGLARAGVLVRSRSAPGRPGQTTGYAVSLPGLAGGSGPIWLACSKLDMQLGLRQMRARWGGGLTGAAPGPEQFEGADARQVYAYAAAVAERGAADIRKARGRDQSAIAWAAADLITSAAWATGSPELHRAADGFRRASRLPWGRSSSAYPPASAMLRSAAYALANCAPIDHRAAVRRALAAALGLLVRAVATVRRDQMRSEQSRRIREERARRIRAIARDEQAPDRAPQVRSLQAEDAARSADLLDRVAGPTWGRDPATLAAAAAGRSPRLPRVSGQPQTTRRRASPGRQ